MENVTIVGTEDDLLILATGSGERFALAIDVSTGGVQLQERALIDASRLPARLVARQWGDES